MKILCKWFGHKYDSVKLAMFNIEALAINSRQLEPKITCKRCSKTIELYKLPITPKGK